MTLRKNNLQTVQERNKSYIELIVLYVHKKIAIILDHSRSRDSSVSTICSYLVLNVNRTEWSPIRFVIIQVINKIGRPRSGSPICLITSIITD